MEAEDVYQSFDVDEATQQYIVHLRKRSAEWKQRALELEAENRDLKEDLAEILTRSPSKHRLHFHNCASPPSSVAGEPLIPHDFASSPSNHLSIESFESPKSILSPIQHLKQLHLLLSPQSKSSLCNSMTESPVGEPDESMAVNAIRTFHGTFRSEFDLLRSQMNQELIELQSACQHIEREKLSFQLQLQSKTAELQFFQTNVRNFLQRISTMHDIQAIQHECQVAQLDQTHLVDFPSHFVRAPDRDCNNFHCSATPLNLDIESTLEAPDKVSDGSSPFAQIGGTSSVNIDGADQDSNPAESRLIELAACESLLPLHSYGRTRISILKFAGARCLKFNISSLIKKSSPALELAPSQRHCSEVGLGWFSRFATSSAQWIQQTIDTLVFSQKERSDKPVKSEAVYVHAWQR